MKEIRKCGGGGGGGCMQDVAEMGQYSVVCWDNSRVKIKKKAERNLNNYATSKHTFPFRSHPHRHVSLSNHGQKGENGGQRTESRERKGVENVGVRP